MLVVLSSTFRRSALQAKLVTIFGPYTELLDFDPGPYTPYFYTLGRDEDNDAFIAIDLYAQGDEPVAAQPLLKTVTLPDEGSRWLGDRRRYLTLAKRLASFADPESGWDAMSSELARGIAHRVMRENKASRAVVRCVRRLSQPLDLTMLLPGFPKDNATAREYDQLVYEADVWIDEDGEVQAQRRSSQAEVAPRRTAPAAGQRGAPARKPASPAPAQPDSVAVPAPAPLSP